MESGSSQGVSVAFVCKVNNRKRVSIATNRTEQERERKQRDRFLKAKRSDKAGVKFQL